MKEQKWEEKHKSRGIRTGKAREIARERRTKIGRETDIRNKNRKR